MMKKINEKNDGIIVVLAACGIIGPVLYIMQVIVIGFLTPDYNPITTMMSFLGGVEGIMGLLFNIGLVLAGVLIGAFALGLHLGLVREKGGVIGPLLLVIAGAGMISAGYFHCDQGCANVYSFTFTGIMHALSAFLTGFSAGVAPLFIYLRIRNDPKWENYRSYTLLTGLIGNAIGIGFWISFMFFRQEARIIIGLIQRLGILIPFLWIVVIAIHLLRVSRTNL